MIGKKMVEWLMERVALREEEIDKIRGNDEIREQEKDQMLKAKRYQSIKEVLEEDEVLIDTHFFNQFSETKSSLFLKKVLANQSAIDTRLFKKTWRSLNCTPKTLKEIREIPENLLCVGLRKELYHKAEDRIEVLLQPDRAATPCEAHHQLLQEG